MAATFGATSTTEDVLAGSDLRDRRVLITGVSAGLGVETARAFVAHGASVAGTARNLERAKAATKDISNHSATDGGLELIELDLASLANVRSCADSLVTTGNSFDLIIANAGVMAGPKERTADGFESQFGTNYIGHFVLINCIAGLLKAGGRLVMVSSGGHRRSDVDLLDPNFDRTPYSEYVAYGRSKTATILFAVEFDKRHKHRKIRATAVHPGAIQTESVQKLVEGLGAGKDAAMAAYDWKTASQGAATSVWAGIVASPDEVGAKYCEDCHVAEINDDPAAKAGVRSYALDPSRALALWTKGEEMVGECFT